MCYPTRRKQAKNLHLLSCLFTNRNSKYWFRRVGDHPSFDPRHRAAAQLALAQPQPAAAFLSTQARWDPFAFIDLCEASHHGWEPCAMLCRQVQQREWVLLFEHCYRAATASAGP